MSMLPAYQTPQTQSTIKSFDGTIQEIYIEGSNDLSSQFEPIALALVDPNPPNERQSKRDYIPVPGSTTRMIGYKGYSLWLDDYKRMTIIPSADTKLQKAMANDETLAYEARQKQEAATINTQLR